VTAERPINDDDLHAAADGRLPPQRQAEVDAAIDASADAAARVGFYRRLNAELRPYDCSLRAGALTAAAALWLVLARAAAAVACWRGAAAGCWYV
jgi:hypothetical protein